MKPLNKVKIKWSPNFAYAIGLLATDGCLSKDKRHIDFSSKDVDQILNFKKCLHCTSKIGTKYSGAGRKSFRVQLGDVVFYKFLISIGFMSNKSKTMARLLIPEKYFFDFLRGEIDGDGSFFAYFDKRWKSSYMFYLSLCCASAKHIYWLRKEINKLLKVRGHITKSINDSTYQLKYAKKESLKLIRKMYYNGDVLCLSRKRFKIERILTINKQLQGARVS